MRFQRVLTILQLAPLSSAGHNHFFDSEALPFGHFNPFEALETQQTPIFNPLRATIAYTSALPRIKTHECLPIDNGIDSFCVFSSQSFANGRGIAILTNPDSIESIQQLPAFREKNRLADVNRRTHPPPFEERELPGRGIGLIANKTIHRGDQIFANSAVLLLDAEAWDTLEEKNWMEMERSAVHKLPRSTKRMVMNLHGHEGIEPINDKVNTNAFEVEIEDGTYFAVFPEIARLNHDCRPNAAYFFDEETLTHYVHAINDIAPGTEITITYIDPHMRRRDRLKSLRSSWGFDCSCSHCSMHRSLTNASDLRLRQIVALSDKFEKRPQTSSLEMAETLISLYNQDRLYAPLSGAYRFAALASCGLGLRWKSLKYAQLALELGILDDGFDNEHYQEMRELALQPDLHLCWPSKTQQ